MEAHCRIRRVRMKQGADVTVLRRQGTNPLGDTMRQHAHEIAAGFGDDLAGYFVIAYGRDGAFNCGSRVPYEGPIPLSLFPSWLAEIARRTLVTTQQIHDTLKDDYIVK